MDIFFFNVSTVGSLTRSPAQACDALRQTHHLMAWVTKGSGVVEIDAEILPVAANTIFSIPSGRRYCFIPSEDVEGYVLSFNIDFLHLALEGSGSSFFSEIKSELSRITTFFWDPAEPGLHKVLFDMRQEFSSDLGLKNEVLSALLKLFLIYLKRKAIVCYREYGEWADTRLFNRFYCNLDNGFKSKKQVAAYASELAVSPGYLNSVVKRATGHSASYHIRLRTIQEAKRMVYYDDANMKTVAVTLGFDDLAHFSKYFKKATGTTFSQFKKIRYPS